MPVRVAVAELLWSKREENQGFDILQDLAFFDSEPLVRSTAYSVLHAELLPAEKKAYTGSLLSFQGLKNVKEKIGYTRFFYKN